MSYIIILYYTHMSCSRRAGRLVFLRRDCRGAQLREGPNNNNDNNTSSNSNNNNNIVV